MKGRTTVGMKDESWHQDFAFAVDIAAQLGDLNLKLQGRDMLITRLYDDVKCFNTKLRLRKSHVSNENFVHFPTCKELKISTNIKSVLGFFKYGSHLELLSKDSKIRFIFFSHLFSIRLCYSQRRLLLMLLRQRKACK